PPTTITHPPKPTLFPYTTLFRSQKHRGIHRASQEHIVHWNCDAATRNLGSRLQLHQRLAILSRDTLEVFFETSRGATHKKIAEENKGRMTRTVLASPIRSGSPDCAVVGPASSGRTAPL